MDRQPGHPAAPAHPLLRSWGFWAVAAGGAALALAFVQIAAPMLEPSPPVSVRIGEAAGEATRSAWNALLGREIPADGTAPPPTAYLALLVPTVGVVALVLSAISGALHENPRLALFGAGLGIGAILVQHFWWLAILVVGGALVLLILRNVVDILGL